MGIDVRGTPEAIDELWMTGALAEAGVSGDAKVEKVEFLGFIGTGQTGRNGRFALTWDAPAAGPASVVCKFPSDDPTARSNAFANGTYIKEWAFYDQVVQTLRIRTPRVYAALYDADTPDFVLLMEDIAGSVQGDQVAGLTPDQAALAAAEAVQLHAPRWGDPSLNELLGGGLSAEMRGFGAMMAYAGTLEGFLARLGDRLDAEVVQLVRDLGPFVSKWAMGTDTPYTVTHMDYRPDNFLFGQTPDAPPIVVVDWQTVADGLAMNDLAYMIGGGFEPAQRAAVERDLVEDYRARLVAEGIDYEADACWRDYRFASVWGVIMTVIATMYAEETERGNDMLTAMAQRHGHHAIDLDALALLA